MDRVLIDYLPSIMQEIEEFQALFKTEQIEIEELNILRENIMNDQFVESATKNGVDRWENVLRITPKATDNLNDRKFRILTRLNGQLPYTMTVLRQQLETLCGVNGYTIDANYQNYTLHVRVSLTAKNNFTDVGDLLNRITPANLVIDLTLLYNQNSTLSKYTYSQMARQTHNYWRNEVLNNGN